MKILVLNAGSSSQKSSLYQLPEDVDLYSQPPQPLWEGKIDWTLNQGLGTLEIEANEITLEIQLKSDDRPFGISEMLKTLIEGKTKVLNKLSEIDLVGHRVVHGGAKYDRATRITEEVKAEIARLIPLAPSHNPANLQGIEAIERLLGDIPQVAVFDTAFHNQMPDRAKIYPIPYDWFKKGIRRYGFHGISHKYCADRAAKLADRPSEFLKIITCHLGNGCSLAAIKDGKSINTTMGFTPLEGLMMGTRSGSIDPAILIYLMREHNFNADELDKMLNQDSGLKGISGLSNDMRSIREGISKGNARAKLAFDMYIHRLKASIGEILASLGGLDILVFTAGIGENSAIVREKACQGFEFLGLKLDRDKNNAAPLDEDIAMPDSKVKIFVLHAEEDWAIARECWQLLPDKFE